jgi:hypothetical protein
MAVERKTEVTSKAGQTRIHHRIIAAMLGLLLSNACHPRQITPTMNIETTQPSSPSAAADTPTPNPCTGWTCEVEGVVYAQSPNPGNELGGISLTLIHNSNCSPTQGQYQGISNPDGSYSFPEDFFHDTDRVRILVDQEGYNAWDWDSAGQYCYYCTCFNQPIQAILQVEDTP